MNQAQQGGGDLAGRQHDVDPQIGRGPRHPVHHRRFLVLGDRKPAAGAYRGRSDRAVGAHSAEHDGDACPSRGCRDALEENITRGAVVAGHGAPVEVQLPGSGELKVHALRRDPGPGTRLRPARRYSDGQGHTLIEPVGEPFDEPGADVLHHEERNRVIGRQRLQQVHENLRTPCRCAHPDHRRPAGEVACTGRRPEPRAQMADHVCAAQHLDPPPESGPRGARRIAQVEIIAGDRIECSGRERGCRPVASGTDAGQDHQDRHWPRAHDFLDSR